MNCLLVPRQEQKRVVFLAIIGSVEDRKHLLELSGVQVHDVVCHQVGQRLDHQLQLLAHATLQVDGGNKRVRIVTDGAALRALA